MNVYSKATERGKRAAVDVLPFARVTTPEHVVSMQNVRTVCASLPDKPQAIAVS